MERHEQTDISRRQFLSAWGGLMGVATLGFGGEAGIIGQEAQGAEGDEGDEWGALSLADLRGAEAIIGLRLTDSERTQVLRGLARQRDQFLARRGVGALENYQSPAQIFDPRLPGRTPRAQGDRLRMFPHLVPDLPQRDVDIAFAPLIHLAAWIRQGILTSERLTRIYLDRLERYDSTLHCVVTLMREEALEQARRADKEIASGRYRGPLHGIPWGAKDLFDTSGVRTTWGAMPFKDRVPETDAYVVKKLADAGAVLVAKLTLGALAMGDVWFDDMTRNPFKTEQGSSGSSAGSAAATAAGLVSFALGTETLGSIVSPSMRCGTTGLRPTFGRVARSGAMALCWSLDKIGPICRSVEDTVLVLSAINGADDQDPSSRNHGFEYDGELDLRKLRVGYAPEWFAGKEYSEERKVLETLLALGVKPVELDGFERSVRSLYTILGVEAAAAFESLTFDGRDERLVRQSDGAWPNLFRKAWFVPAVEYVQADRLRREVMEQMAKWMDQADVLISPSYAGELLIATNFTGHPSLTLRSAMRDDGTPTGITLWGGLFEEGVLCAVGRALEESLDVWSRRPPLFAS